MIVYKYLSPDRIDVLQNCMVRYTQPESFNDPFEVKPNICRLSEEQESYSAFDELISKALRENYEKLPQDFRALVSFDRFYQMAMEEAGPNAKEQFYKLVESCIPIVRQMITDGFNKAIGIFSLTEKPDNLLMWSHYAASHEGFVIGFDSNHPYFNEKKGPDDEFGYLRQVKYCETRPTLVMIEMSGTDILLVKSTQWDYEQEWRIIRPLQEANKIIQADSCPIHLFQFPMTAVKEVILGCRMSEKRKQEIKAILTSESFQHVRVRQAEPDELEFKLNISSINPVV